MRSKCHENTLHIATSILSIDTCDSNWQSTRDSLIITAFVFSLLSILIIIAAGILFVIGYFYFKQGVCMW